MRRPSRREVLIGSAALAACTQVNTAKALTGPRRALLGSAGNTLGGEVQILGTQIGVGLSDTGTGSASNLFNSTQIFTAPDWNTLALSANDNQTTSPDGTVDAAALTEGAGTSAHAISQGYTQVAAATQYTINFSVKKALRTRVVLFFEDLSLANGAYVVYDVNGGQIGVAATTYGTGWTGASAAAPVLQSNGFYLCTLTVTTPSAATYITAGIEGDAGSGTGALNQVYAGNTTTPALYVYGAQLVLGNSAPAYTANTNKGLAATQLNSGDLTKFWGSLTANAWAGVDAGIAVQWTRYAFTPRPGSTSPYSTPLALDSEILMQGNLVQTGTDSGFSSPSTVDTIPATPYYARFNLNSRSVSGNSRYIRMLPSSSNYGSIGQLQFFANYAPAIAAVAAPVAPAISPWGGQFPSGSSTVTISSATRGAKIYYTTDGTTPTPASTLYSGPFTLNIGVGSTVTLKAIAYVASFGTTTSAVSSSVFYGYGFSPKQDIYDNRGILVEAHSGNVSYDPNTSLYYWVGSIANKYSPPGLTSGTANIIRNDVGVLMYSSPTGYAPWTFVGNILPEPTGWFSCTRPHLMYNAANNNYVIWAHVENPNASSYTSDLIVATASAITGPWTWGSTFVTNAAADTSTFIDTDGTGYIVYVNGQAQSITIAKLASDYKTITASTVVLTSVPYREAPVLLRNGSAGNYFLITSQSVPYDSVTTQADLRYITSAGANPLSGWGSLPGATAFASEPAANSGYNGQGSFALVLQGKTQPFIGTDWWQSGSNFYGSRQTWLPITFPTASTLNIGIPATWDFSGLN